MHIGAHMNIKEKYTVSEATELLGFKSRSTINSRTKKSGSDALTYEIDEEGNKVISHVELERVFPSKFKAALKRKNNTPNTSYKNTQTVQSNTPKSTSDIRVLSDKIEFLNEQLDYERQERERERQEAKKREERSDEREQDLSDKLNKAQSIIEKQTFLISDMREKPVQKPIEPPKKILGIFPRKTA